MIRGLLLLIVAGVAFVAAGSAVAEEWTFVWVTSGTNGYSIAKGKAQVSLAGGKLDAQMIDDEGVEYTIRGTITKSKVRASFTVVDSDYFKSAPFSGTYLRKQWSGFAESQGRESISLSDGWNFLGLVREIRKP